MKIKDCMTPQVALCSPGEPISDVARRMAEHDTGVIPVSEGDRLVGMITDRDIAIRAVAAGLSPQTPVRTVMTAEVRYCYEDDSVNDVLDNMGDLQVRRLPVLNRDKRLIGIVSLSDLARDQSANAAHALHRIAQETGRHSQTLQ
jgi:CBS domain-containing protein